MTAVVVAYGITSLDISWLPPDGELIVVHNDDRLPADPTDPRVRHLNPGDNIGFGAAVNRALEHVRTPRTVLVNPDVRLTTEHWRALVDDRDANVRTIALLDDRDEPTVTVAPYPGPAHALAHGLRLGRLAGRNGVLRRVVAPANTGTASAGTWPLRDRWPSGAAVSFRTEQLRAVGGFDPAFFLYVEDLDLSERLAAAFPGLAVEVVDVPPATHAVGGTARSSRERRRVERLRLASWQTYARRKRGWQWRLVGGALAVRAWGLRHDR